MHITAIVLFDFLSTLACNAFLIALNESESGQRARTMQTRSPSSSLQIELQVVVSLPSRQAATEVELAGGAGASASRGTIQGASGFRWRRRTTWK